MTPSEADAALEGLRAACLAGEGDQSGWIAWLAGVSVAELRLLSEQARRLSWYWYPSTARTEWDDALGRGDLLTECLGSFQANGYVRERAVRLLAARTGGLVARCLAL